MGNDIKVGLEIDDDKAKSQLKGFEKNADKSGRKIGNEIGDGVEKGIGRGLSSVKSKILSVGAVLVATFGARAALVAAARQEDAINQINTSLKLAGSFSEEASQSFQGLARSLQETTTFGDETILQFGALARNFTQTNKEAERLTKAAVDLSAATGLSLESSVKNLGKTFAGLTGELGESVPALRGLSVEALKSGAAIDLILTRFGGAAAAQAQTFSGGIKQLGNIIGDVAENIGQLVTNSPIAVKIVGDLSKSFISLGQSIRAFGSGGDVFGQFIISTIKVGEAINMFVVAPLELLFNSVMVVFNGIQVAAQAFVGTIANTASGIVNLFSPDSELAQTLNNFSAAADDVFVGFANDANNSLDNIFNFDVAAKGAEFLESYRMVLGQVKQANKESIIDLSESNAEAASNTIDISKQLQGAMTQAISQGVSAIGAALAQGQNAFAAFGKVILSIIGDFAIQIGTTLVGIGLGIDSLKAALTSLTGGVAIAAGFALIALGGALKSLGSGPGLGGTAAVPGSNASPGATEPSPTDVGSGFNNADTKPSTNFQLVVEGNILDRRESGLEILNILNETAESNGIKITT